LTWWPSAIRYSFASRRALLSVPEPGSSIVAAATAAGEVPQPTPRLSS